MLGVVREIGQQPLGTTAHVVDIPDHRRVQATASLTRERAGPVPPGARYPEMALYKPRTVFEGYS